MICTECGFSTTNEETFKENRCCCRQGKWVPMYLYRIDDLNKGEEFKNNMLKLRDENPVEFELKLTEFERIQRQEEERIKMQNANKRKCRYCGCTEFTPVRKKWSPLTGIFTNKTDLVCNNCGRKVAWIDK